MHHHLILPILCDVPVTKATEKPHCRSETANTHAYRLSAQLSAHAQCLIPLGNSLLARMRSVVLVTSVHIIDKQAEV